MVQTNRKMCSQIVMPQVEDARLKNMTSHGISVSSSIDDSPQQHAAKKPSSTLSFQYISLQNVIGGRGCHTILPTLNFDDVVNSFMPLFNPSSPTAVDRIYEYVLTGNAENTISGMVSSEDALFAVQED